MVRGGGMKKAVAIITLCLVFSSVVNAKTYNEYLKEYSELKGNSKENIEKRIELYKEALKEKVYNDAKEESYFYSMICLNYSKTEFPTSGIEYCNKAIDSYPDNFSAYMSLGIIYEKKREFKEAIDYANKSISKLDKEKDKKMITFLNNYIEKLKLKDNATQVFEVLALYNKNSLYADEVLKNKEDVYWGYAYEISRDEEDRLRIVFSTPDMIGGIAAYFDESMKKNLMKIKKYDAVYFTGFVTGQKKSIYTTIENCRILP